MVDHKINRHQKDKKEQREEIQQAVWEWTTIKLQTILQNVTVQVQSTSCMTRSLQPMTKSQTKIIKINQDQQHLVISPSLKVTKVDGSLGQ